jgi:hypothetical protein
MKSNYLFFVSVLFLICGFAIKLIAQSPVTVYLEDGKSIAANSFKGSKGKISADGVDYYQKELLFVKSDNKMKIMNYKSGKLRQMKKSFVLDPKSMADLGKIYAVKYYNTKSDPSTISDEFKTLMQDPNFMASYNEFKKKLKSSAVLSGVAIGVTVVAVIIVVPLFLSTLKQANSL